MNKIPGLQPQRTSDNTSAKKMPPLPPSSRFLDDITSSTDDSPPRKTDGSYRDMDAAPPSNRFFDDSLPTATKRSNKQIEDKFRRLGARDHVLPGYEYVEKKFPGFPSSASNKGPLKKDLAYWEKLRPFLANGNNKLLEILIKQLKDRYPDQINELTSAKLDEMLRDGKFEYEGKPEPGEIYDSITNKSKTIFEGKSCIKIQISECETTRHHIMFLFTVEHKRGSYGRGSYGELSSAEVTLFYRYKNITINKPEGLYELIDDSAPPHTPNNKKLICETPHPTNGPSESDA